jgi:hypothetical protein
VYVPSPREKVRSTEERIAAISKKTASPHLPEDVLPIEHEGSLAQLLGASEKDWERRKQKHLEFLETTESSDAAQAYYEIRFYIQNAPYCFVGRWIEVLPDANPNDFEPNEIAAGGYWSTDSISDWRDSGPDYKANIDKVRQHIIKVFREVLGDAKCPHNNAWDDWKPKNSWDKMGSAGCAKCFLQSELANKGLNPGLAEFPDAKPLKNKNTRSANTILNVLGLSKWNESDPRHESTANNEKLTRIDAAGRRDSCGKRVKPRGIGADSSDRVGDDSSGGSQDTSSRDPNYSGRRTAAQLGLTTDPKKLKKDYRAAVMDEERELARANGETDDKELNKRVNARMKAEYPDYLKKQKALKAAEADAATVLPVPVTKEPIDRRKYKKLPAFDSTGSKRLPLPVPKETVSDEDPELKKEDDGSGI